MTLPVNPTGVITPVASLFVDHSDLGTFNQAVRDTAHLSAGPRQVASQTFWSTPERAANSPVQETLEITLSSTRLVNFIKLDAAIFPQIMNFEYWDGISKWVPFLDKSHLPLFQRVMRSIPTQLPNPVSVPGHLHPQHSYLGHWRTVEMTTLPAYVQRIRFILQRYDNGLGPVDVLGNKVKYSLALRNILFGYRVATREDLPRALPQDDTYSEPFASTDDLLGSSLAFSVRDPTVNRILGNTDTDADTIWMCEPQPYPSAVVNFYADLRDSRGQAQVIDQIYCNPVNSGAHVTVYWSDDLPMVDYESSTNPLDITQAVPTGSVMLQDQRLKFGQYGDQAYLSIGNVIDTSVPIAAAQRHKAVLGYDPVLPWWMGVTVRPDFNQGVDSVEHPIFDCGFWRLSLTTAGLTLTRLGYDPRICAISYLGGQDITLVVSYDGAGSFHMHAVTIGDEATLDFWAQPFEPGPCPTVLIGTDTTNQYFLNSDLINFVLKEGIFDASDEEFLTTPASFCTVAQFAGDDLPQSSGALLRLDPTATTLINATYPWALFGGPQVKYDQMVWSPVPRDYVMQRGWMYLPPTKAKFFKLEITNLQAIPYDIAISGAQQVRTFPPDVLAAYRQRLVNSSSDAQPLGLTLQMQLSGTSPYADVPTFISTGGNGLRGYTNTEVYISDDYTTGQRLRALQTENWGYQTYHVGTTAPRFTQAQVHDYSVDTVTRSGKIAYQTGLRQIAFAYSSFTTQQDTGMYEETFYSDANMETSTDKNNMVYDPTMDALHSGTTQNYAQASSLVYSSLRDVRAVQYAVQQSPPNQLLPDDDFEDPTFSNWDLVGDADPPPQGIVYSPLLGSLLPVARSVVLGRWGDIRNIFGTWGGISTLGYSYNDLRSKQTTATPRDFGGVQNAEAVPQPPGGRVYAAARVIAEQDLISPLYLEIIDSITGARLASEPIDVKADQVTEWYVGYNVGEAGDVKGNLWGDLSGVYLDNYPSFADSFDGPDSTTLDLMDSGQQWTTPTNSAGSLAIVNNLAVCNAAGQVSVVDTFTPWGVMSVQLGASVLTGTASASVPLLYLGHIRFMNDGRFVDSNTGRVLATLTGIAANDTFQFDFLPTTLVPVGSLPPGVDPTVQAWAIIVTWNGIVRSPAICTTRSFGTRRGLAGAVGQQFQSFSWAPHAAGIPPGLVIGSQPMPTDGVQDDTGTTWTQTNGRVWATQDVPSQNPPVPPTFGTGPVWQASPNTISAPAFPATTPSVVLTSTDVGPTLGTLTFRITQLAATVPTNSYSVALLDQALGSTSLELRANGDLVRIVAGTPTTLKAAAIAPAQMVGTDIGIKYVTTSQLSAAFRATWSIPGPDPVTGIYPSKQTMIFLVNDAVASVYSGNGIWVDASTVTPWLHAVRGVYGYNDNAGHYTVTTGWAWSSDANAVSTGKITGAGVSWGEVDNYNSRLWGDLSQSVTENLNPLYARVVQFDASNDTWYQDTLSLFSDPIVWEFSNNGGKSWVPGWDVMNNPDAAVAFNPKPSGDLTAVANQFCYRVTVWAPDKWISHLAIRPWYLGFMRGVPTHPLGSFQGPNVSPWDHYPPIENDPRWKMWHLPIPREWWFAFRTPDLTPHYTTPYVTDNVLVNGG